MMLKLKIYLKYIKFNWLVYTLYFLGLQLSYNAISAHEVDLSLKLKPLPQHKPIPGGVAIIPLDLDDYAIPTVFFNDRQVLVTKYHNLSPNNALSHGWVAVIGIPMDVAPGLHHLTIYLSDFNNLEENQFTQSSQKSFMISPGKYITEKISLNHKFVNPSYAEQIRINKEKNLINKAYNYRSSTIPSFNFVKPIKEARISSKFGTKRILNGQARGFHTGIDLAAPIGTKVYAAGDGKVILIGDFFYTGNAVFIDHGQGIITSYSHLNSIMVNEGDQVDAATIIGTVGTTGRSNGPHLHWSVSLNNARVNPELFVNL